MSLDSKKRIPDNVLFPYGKTRIEESKGIQRWLLRWIPYYFFLALRQELYLIRLRIKVRLRGIHIESSNDALVNLGCGSSGKDGWVNIDMYGGNNISAVYDLRKHIPLADGVAKGIFCEHFVEHLEYSEEIPYFISECYRVLQPGGVLRIIVPDAEAYLRAYCAGGWDDLTRIRPLKENRMDRWYGNRFETRMELVNLVFRQGIEHKFAYDWETLDNLLRKHEFSSVMRCKYGCGTLKELCIDRSDRASESLYVEAIK